MIHRVRKWFSSNSCQAGLLCAFTTTRRFEVGDFTGKNTQYTQQKRILIQVLEERSHIAASGELSWRGMAEAVPYTSAAVADQRRKKNALDKARANYVSAIALLKGVG